MRYGVLVAAIAAIFLSLSGSIWWLAARCDGRVTPEQFDGEIELRAQRIRSAHIALMNCSKALARATVEIEGLSNFTVKAAQLGQGTTDLKRSLEKATKRIKVDEASLLYIALILSSAT